ASRALTGRDFAAALGLHSARFSLAVVSLDAPARIPGGKLRLTGVAENAQGAVIQRLTAGGGWGPAAGVRPRRDGPLSAVVRRQPTGVYRVALDQVAGPPVRATTR